jgi:hypothetical protein
MSFQVSVSLGISPLTLLMRLVHPWAHWKKEGGVGIPRQPAGVTLPLTLLRHIRGMGDVESNTKMVEAQQKAQSYELLVDSIPAWQELPPLAYDPSFELRINKHNISEFRAPKVMIVFRLSDEFRYRKRYRWSPVTTVIDIAAYRVGWIFSLWPIITIMKVKTSKIMETPKYLTIIKIFETEYQRA